MLLVEKMMKVTLNGFKNYTVVVYLVPSFQPDYLIRALRSLVRHRKNLVQESTSYLKPNAKSFRVNEYKSAYRHK
jgi:hypothetical protein